MAAASNKSAAAPLFTRVFVSSVALWRRVVDRVRRAFGLPTLYEAPVTTQELKSLLKRGIEAGVFAPSEQDMVEAGFFLGTRSARSLMTPRTRIVWLNLADPPEKIAKKLAASGHSRFPVARGTLDDTVGIVESKELLAAWLLDGMLPVDEFKELFKLDNLPGERRDAYQTLGGFLYTQMGRVPGVAERFEWDGLRFEIVDMDGKRIDKVLVMELPAAPEVSEE